MNFSASNVEKCANEPRSETVQNFLFFDAWNTPHGMNRAYNHVHVDLPPNYD